MIKTCTAILLLASCILHPCLAQTVPTLVNYQGRLTDDLGNPVSGTVSIVITVHSHETNNAEVYNEIIGSVAVNNGIYNFQFGSGATFPPALANAEAWLSVSVDNTVLSPRQRLIAVPYAVVASTVRGPDLHVDPNSGSVGIGTDTPKGNFPLTLQARNDLETYLLFLSTTGRETWFLGGLVEDGLNFGEAGEDNFRLFLRRGGNVGIGTNTPDERLEVAGAIKLADTSNATPAAGTIRWTGTDFEGFNGTDWVSLTFDNGPLPPLVSIEMVTVGNPGNDDDTDDNGNAPGDHSGRVEVTYKIGKYEVTNTEYTAFLNAVDATGANALALYSTNMGTFENGGITLTPGNADGSKYEVKAGFPDKPVVYVSFYDAMRFCNWLHNGAQAGGDTEVGAYTLLGGAATPTNGTTVERNSGAKFAVPTEDEWYKAAYHQPSGAGGDASNYWLYPTQSDSAPNNEPPPGTAPAANYDDTGGSLTDVGAYSTTIGYYGTFDMAGNVFELLETRLGGSSRLERGGSWFNLGVFLRSADAVPISPGTENVIMGFRISSP